MDLQSLYSALDQLMADDYEVEERMMLEGCVYRGDELIGKDIALNDIVIGRDGHLRVVRFKNYVNDVYLILIMQMESSFHTYRIYGLQSVGRRSYCITECSHDHYDTYCPSYSEYKKHYFSIRRCDHCGDRQRQTL